MIKNKGINLIQRGLNITMIIKIIVKIVKNKIKIIMNSNNKKLAEVSLKEK